MRFNALLATGEVDAQQLKRVNACKTGSGSISRRSKKAGRLRSDLYHLIGHRGVGRGRQRKVVAAEVPCGEGMSQKIITKEAVFYRRDVGGDANISYRQSRVLIHSSNRKKIKVPSVL
jgi:hypothetical protein